MSRQVRVGRWTAPLRLVVAVQLAVLAGALAVVLVPALGAGGTAQPVVRSEAERQLLSQVEVPGGAPKAGRDPAVQRQVGLAEAAGRPVAVGKPAASPGRTAKGSAPSPVPSPVPSSPAAPVVGPNVGGQAPLLPVTQPRDPKAVLGDPKSSGVTSGGCAVGYGIAGAQCVPAKAPGGTDLTCAYLVTLFPDGVALSGPDRLALDTNGDQVACGPGDAGVPADPHASHT